MVKLSICIPTFNRLESLKKQVSFFTDFVKYHDDCVELIISNNCSTDGTKEYLESIEKNQEVIVNNNEKNEGLIGNLISVCNIAKGQYIWVVGDDDYIYKDTPDRVLDIIKESEGITHIFLNYLTKENNRIIDNPIYKGPTGLFEDAFEMFSEITQNASIGLNMFLSANVYLRSEAKKTIDILKTHDEIDNLSLPLGWSLFCSSGKGFIIGEVSIENQLAGISWTDSKVRVFYRDQIAVCDILSQDMGMNDKMNDLLIKNMPSTYPAIKFAVLNKNRTINNYASKWLWKNYKMVYIKDIICFPFYLGKLLIHKFTRK